MKMKNMKMRVVGKKIIVVKMRIVVKKVMKKILDGKMKKLIKIKILKNLLFILIQRIKLKKF